MSNTYIRFSQQPAGKHKLPGNIGRKLITVPTESDIPVSNPDFIDKMKDVFTWLIEFENDSYFPEREIGIDRSGVTVMIMPWRKNYGYWTDNDLTIENFKAHFETVAVTKVEFENRWKSFEQKQLL